MTDQLKRSLSIPHIIKFAYDENKEREHLKKFEQEILNLKEGGPALIIKTMGEKGVCYKLKSKKWKHQDAINVNSILDTCGAGDWCTSGFIYALNDLSKSKKQDLLEFLNNPEIISNALRVGQAIASISLEYLGAKGLSYSINKKELFSKIKKLIDLKKIGFAIDKYDHECINKSVFKPKKGNYCSVCLI
jgi:sugar/nucleoside kinase (ribokinase family)